MARTANGATRSELDVLYAEHAPKLYRLAFLLTGSRHDADDLIQGVFIKFASKSSSVENPYAYLRTSVVNAASNARRSSFRLRLVGDDDLAALAGASTVEHSTGPERSALEFLELLHGVSANQRAALILRYWDNASDSEIGAVIGCSESTVRSHLRRGLATLRKGLR